MLCRFYPDVRLVSSQWMLCDRGFISSVDNHCIAVILL
jgi:hypothetical protein